MTTAAHRQTPPPASDTAHIKRVPAQVDARGAIRARAAELAVALAPSAPPSFEALRSAGQEVLRHLRLPEAYLGFAMVAVDNAYWAAEFEATAPERRLLLLPRCLRDSAACRADQDAAGLHCAGCGSCSLHELQQRARDLGMAVVVAEGTTAVVAKVLEGEADAILGVACLDSLEKSFEAIADLGIPHRAIPLLTDGCVDTQAELDLIHAALTALGTPAGRGRPTYLPLLRETQRIFEAEALEAALLSARPRVVGAPPFAATDDLAAGWLKSGGKRLRPFITLAAYAVGKHGPAALEPQADLAALIPDSVRRIAVAIEALHKASLAHDDIEDQDALRYGQPTLHQAHGVAAAINVGDHLLGLGYRLVAAQAPELGAECVADILARLSVAHLQLCCGQGAELLWYRGGHGEPRPLDALQIGALKTAPAFELALVAGLRPAQAPVDEAALRRFTTLIGQGFQVLNDLADWEEEGDNKVAAGNDVLRDRPTILRAFAVEAGGADDLRALAAQGNGRDEAAALLRTQELYTSLGAFERAEALYARLRERALGAAEEVGGPPLRDLLRFLTRNILRKRLPPRPAELVARGEGV